MSSEKKFGSVKLLTRGLGVKHEKARKNKLSVEQIAEGKSETKVFKKVLLAIQGLGKRTVEKILELYPSKASLKKAFKDGKVVHTNDEINKDIEQLI